MSVSQSGGRAGWRWARPGRGEGRRMEAGRERRPNKVTTQTDRLPLRGHMKTERGHLCSLKQLQSGCWDLRLHQVLPTFTASETLCCCSHCDLVCVCSVPTSIHILYCNKSTENTPLHLNVLHSNIFKDLKTLCVCVRVSSSVFFFTSLCLCLRLWACPLTVLR